MRISLKRFTRDPYKYVKKAPLLLLLGDYPRYAIIPYSEYKKHFIEDIEPQDQAPTIQIISGDKPKRSRLWRLLFG